MLLNGEKCSSSTESEALLPDGVHEDVEGAGAVARLRHGHLGRPLRRRLGLGQEGAPPRPLVQLEEEGGRFTGGTKTPKMCRKILKYIFGP